MQQHGSKYFAIRPQPTHHPVDPGVGSKGQNYTFQNIIKLNRIKNAATW